MRRLSLSLVALGLLSSSVAAGVLGCSLEADSGSPRPKAAPRTTDDTADNADAPREPKAESDAPSGNATPNGNGSGATAGSSGELPSPGPDAGAGAGGDAGGAKVVDATNGSGGPTGFRELRSTGGLTYQINAPAAAGPHGLLVLLHGSGASNYDKFVAMMEKVATAHDLLRVSVLAPNGQGWNEGGQAAQTQAAKLLHDLVQQDLFPKYNIDRARVLFSGQSSGGGFLSTHFVPLYAESYKGGALLQCGAAPPAVQLAPSDATKRAFRLHFEITTGDTIWPDSYKRAVATYTQAGMQLTKDDTKPGGHCQFDQQQVILDHIGFLLGPR